MFALTSSHLVVNQAAATLKRIPTPLAVLTLFSPQTCLSKYVQGQSRGFGFVHFEDATVARTACDGMHGKMVDGRPLVVRVRSDPIQPSSRPAGGPPHHVSAPGSLPCPCAPVCMRLLCCRLG